MRDRHLRRTAAARLRRVGARPLRALVGASAGRRRGPVAVDDLDAPVRIVWDRWAVPHVFGRNERGAFFGQGFCHARDRLWHMDTSRRLATGSLAEAFGRRALETDRLMRRIGLHRSAAEEWRGLDGPARVALEAYAAGVNALVARYEARGRRPLEYALARVPLPRWTPEDCLAVGRLFAFTLSPNWESELVRSGAAAAGAARRAREETAYGGVPPASNCWVVSGERAENGAPLLANDPHLWARFPPLLYEAHLRGGELDVAGATVPGVPGVVIGHNRDVAWGVTAALADVQDLFVERLDDSGRASSDGEWAATAAYDEDIVVRGGATERETVLVTRHGPVVTPTPALPGEARTLALASTVLRARATIAPLLGLNRARSCDSFRAVLREWQTPVLNFCFADRTGRVGYQLAGHVPTRASGDGLAPSQGWTGATDWTGTVAFDELPGAADPAEWATANHDVARGSHVYLGQEFAPPTRYERIRSLLSRRPRHSVASFAAIQLDQHSAIGAELARALVDVLDPRARGVEVLAGWDGTMSADSPAPALYHAFVRALVREQTGGDDASAYGAGPHPVIAPLWYGYMTTTTRARDVVVAAAGSGDGAAVAAIRRAFARAVGELEDLLGRDASRWAWGDLHVQRPRHPLARSRPVSLLFDPPPLRVGGDAETVHATGPVPGRFEAGGLTPAYRIVMDCADWDETRSCLPGGQSGDPADPHYTDQLELWSAGRLHRFPFGDAAVARAAVSTEELVPRGG